MPVDINQFRALDRQESYVQLDSNRAELEVRCLPQSRIKRAVSWVLNKLGVHQNLHNDTRMAFVDSLRSGYGDEVFNHISHELHTLRAGRPLTTRRVQQIISLADQFQEQRASASTASPSSPTPYNPDLSLVDDTRISQKEVDEIMPHLFAKRLKQSEENPRTSDAQKADILHLKYDFLKEYHQLEASNNGMTRGEVGALARYIDAPDINQALGLGGGPDGLKGSKKQQYTDMMTGLGKLNNNKTITYRGTNATLATVQKFKGGVGDVFRSTAFLSTSASPNFAKSFGDGEIKNQSSAADCNIIYQIIGRTGKNIAGIEDKNTEITDKAKVNPEDVLGNGEVLFAPNAKFRLVAFAEHPTEEKTVGMIFQEEDFAQSSHDTMRDLRKADAVAPVPGFSEDLQAEFVKISERN